ncbi:DUF4296 domain-containing protein [Pedobacter sp.]|uniref:DUF4296 domain-containing protein n=1 Tax=Pedobacter sp. TaxID=1411316 RepID=UPI00396C7969
MNILTFRPVFALLFVATLLFSCKPGIPKDIIQPDKMEKILYDIHVVDGYATTLANQDSAKKVSAPLYKGIYKKYAVDSALYNKSLSYYYKNPDLFNKMYERITETLKKEREKESERAAKKLTLKPVE